MPERPTTLSVSLAAVRQNLAWVRAQAPGRKVVAVVKANAYGLGAIPIARALEADRVDALAVAYANEGAELREADVKSPILVLAVRDEDMPSIVQHGLCPALFTPGQLERYSALSPRGTFHLKIDTGMARLGAIPAELDSTLAALARTQLRLTGVFSQFANADHADPRNLLQWTKFARVRAILAERGQAPEFVHMANSAAILTLEQVRTLDVRPGLELYGVSPIDSLRPALSPAARWTTRPVYVRAVPPGTVVSYGSTFQTTRATVLATLPVGYADGYSRRLSGNAQVLIAGRRAPVVGTICMDLCMIDVTDIPNVSCDSEVVLLGPQGHDAISAQELAAWSGTIPYEILCGIHSRVKREYVD